MENFNRVLKPLYFTVHTSFNDRRLMFHIELSYAVQKIKNNLTKEKSLCLL